MIGTRMRFEHLDKDGNVIWSQDWTDNFLLNQGEQNILDVYFRNQNAPSQFYIRLINDAPEETDTLTDIQGEPSGNGYAPQLVERNTTGFPTLEIDNGDYQVITKEVLFTANGGPIGPVNYAILATSADDSGLYICAVALSQTRTLQDGESLKVSITTKAL